MNHAGWWSRVLYRVGQFLRGLTARPSAADRALVRELLPVKAQALFARMPGDAQVHSLNVLKTLLADGDVTPDLAAAALLHDVGKVAARDGGAYLGLWMRGPIVLMEAARPTLLRRWASSCPSSSPRYALHVHLEHPHIGAAWARKAGCSELTCWLIEHHQDRAFPSSVLQREQLDRLQRADGRN